MRLTPKEQAVLAAVEFDAEVSLTSLVKKLRMPVATIRYNLTNLLERGVVRYYPFIDVLALGYTPYELFFTLTNGTKRDEVLAFMRAAPSISWLAEFGGGFEYCATILTRSSAELTAVLDELSNRFGNVFARKSIASQTSFTLFQTKYLYGGRQAYEDLTWTAVSAARALDELDERILTGLMTEEYASRRDLGRKLGIAISTLDERIKRLIQRGIIRKFIFLINPLALQMHTFKLLLYTAGLPTSLHDALREYCRKHPHITTLIRCVGSWDYEIGIEVAAPAELRRIVQDLQSHFGSAIAEIRELAQFNELKVCCYPFTMKSQLRRVANG